MIRCRCGLALFLFAMVFSVFLSCTKEDTPDRVEIPFILKDGRIVLYAAINGRQGRFILDTGAAYSNINTKTINAKNLLPGGFARAILGGRHKRVLRYALNNITFGDIKLTPQFWLVKARSDNLTNLIKNGYDGALGIGIFEGYWCELSFSKSKIILHKEMPDYFTNYAPVQMQNKYNNEFYIPVTIDGVDYNIMLDTGLPAGIFFPDGIIQFKKPNDYQEIISDEEAAQYHLVKTSSIHILDETYTDAYIMTNSIIAARRRDTSLDNLGLLGIDFLKYYDLLLDCRELRKGKTTGLYYEPNTPLEKRDYGFYSFIKEPPEFGVVNYTDGFFSFKKEAPELGGANFSVGYSGVFIQSVVKDSIAYSAFGLRPGSIIVKINSKPVTVFPREELFGPSFYRTVHDITVLEDGVERVIVRE